MRTRTFDRSRHPARRHKWRNYLTTDERDNLVFLEKRELRALREVTEMRKEIQALRYLGTARAAEASEEVGR